MVKFTVMGLAQRLHRLGKTRCDSWGYWVEIERKQWAEEGAGSSCTVITAIPAAQFHTLMNIVKGTGVSGTPAPPPAANGFSVNHLHAASILLSQKNSTYCHVSLQS